jgi:hypothetical protein
MDDQKQRDIARHGGETSSQQQDRDDQGQFTGSDRGSGSGQGGDTSRGGDLGQNRPTDR